MQVLSQSAFLQALGYAIANSLWQAALLWLVVAGVNGLFKISSQVKYKVALVAQFSAFAWFLVTLQFYYNKCSEAIAQLKFSGLNSSNAFVLQPGAHNFSSVMLSAIVKGEKLLPYLSIAYLCLLGILAVRWIKGYRQTVLIKTQGLQKIDVQWRLFVKRISELLNIKHTVHIYVSDLVKSPLTVGFIKPLILIPVASINNLTTYQLEAVILHELAHIKRADYIINIIQSIIEIALFFNPFTQLLGKIIKRERENSCDDWVLQFQYDPSTYAEALLRIAYMQQTPAFAMNAGGKENDLLWRVKRMLNQSQRTFQYRNRLFALLLITGLLSSIAWFNPSVNTAAPRQADQKQSVIVEPLATKIDNPFFNPVFFLNKPFKTEVNQAVRDAQSSLDATQAAYGLGQAKEMLARVVPAAADQIKTINIDLPGIMSQAGDAVNTALTKFNVNSEVSKQMKLYTDSAFSFVNLINNATNAVKAIDVKKMTNDITKGQLELTRQLGDKDLFAGVQGTKLKEVINKSLDEVKQSLFTVLQSGDEKSDDGDDDDSHIILFPSGSLIQKQLSTKAIKLQKIEKKYIEVKKTVDSLRTAANMRKLNIHGILPGDIYTNVTPVYNNQPAVYSYSMPAGVNNTFLQAKYDQNKDYDVTLSNGSDLSVTSKGNSTLIAVKEEAENADSYKKRITIETLDSTGKKHVFHLTVEVYQ